MKKQELGWSCSEFLKELEQRQYRQELDHTGNGSTNKPSNAMPKWFRISTPKCSFGTLNNGFANRGKERNMFLFWTL